MLQALSFEGTTKVLNKGVDVALVIEPLDAEQALRAAKICGVCGVSTAVLSVTETDPVDRRTIAHFCGTAGRLVFADRALYDAAACSLTEHTKVLIAPDKSAKAFSDTVFAVKRQG